MDKCQFRLKYINRYKYWSESAKFDAQGGRERGVLSAFCGARIAVSRLRISGEERECIAVDLRNGPILLS